MDEDGFGALLLAGVVFALAPGVPIFGGWVLTMIASALGIDF